jgi:hypothetical protein
MAASRKKRKSRSPARKSAPAKRKTVASKRGKTTRPKVKPRKPSPVAAKARMARKSKARPAPRKPKGKVPARAAGNGKQAAKIFEPEEAELFQSLKKNPHHHRLPPSKRHEVPEDERVERDGEPGQVFVGADTEDEEAQQLGEEFVRSVTSGEEAESEMEEEAQVEEQGGPFVITTARQEFAYDSDESNPPGTEREPFPRVSLPVKPKAD